MERFLEIAMQYNINLFTSSFQTWKCESPKARNKIRKTIFNLSRCRLDMMLLLLSSPPLCCFYYPPSNPRKLKSKKSSSSSVTFLTVVVVIRSPLLIKKCGEEKKTATNFFPQCCYLGLAGNELSDAVRIMKRPKKK